MFNIIVKHDITKLFYERIILNGKYYKECNILFPFINIKNFSIMFVKEVLWTVLKHNMKRQYLKGKE